MVAYGEKVELLQEKMGEAFLDTVDVGKVCAVSESVEFAVMIIPLTASLPYAHILTTQIVPTGLSEEALFANDGEMFMS